MGKYTLNQETQKIELHFSKVEYLALSESQKSEIKSKFLWSGKAGAWVSRSTNNHYWAEQVAKKLGLEDGGKVGERLSYAEELERKTERAEARAERYEQYSDNAEKRAENFQADFNKYRKDWSWLTQPIIAGHAGSRAFANHRNKVMARYERGFEEYKKSEYYQDRAKTARETASNAKLQDKAYLGNKIKECNKELKIYQDCIIKYENALYKIQQGEILRNRSGEVLTTGCIEQRIIDLLEKYEWENDKLEFFESCLSELGGITYSKDNVKKGDFVKIRGSWGKVLSANPTTVRILNSLGWDWMKYPYSEIQEYKQAEQKGA
jgi:ribosomal protein L24